MRLFLLAAGVVLPFAAAQADTISYTAQVPPIGYDAYGGYELDVLTPGFDGALGTLDSVTMTVQGTVQDSIVNLGGDLLPFDAVFDNIGKIDGFGLTGGRVLSQNTGIATTFLVDNGFAVDAGFSTSQDLAAYASAAIVSTGYAFYSKVTNAETGQVVRYRSDYAVFSGSVTETFSYTALPVPEPGSSAILAVGLLALTDLARRRGA